jgi:hypothetical protein
MKRRLRSDWSGCGRASGTVVVADPTTLLETGLVLRLISMAAP